MNETLLDLTFAHPKLSTTYPAQVSPDTTAAMAVDELAKAKFITPPSAAVQYVLVHQASNATIPDGSSFGSVGVKNNDVILVTEKTSGAGSVVMGG